MAKQLEFAKVPIPFRRWDATSYFLNWGCSCFLLLVVIVLLVAKFNRASVSARAFQQLAAPLFARGSRVRRGGHDSSRAVAPLT
jgi:hypothetical protein